MKCGDCAFIPGTEASNSPNTLVIAHLCTLTGEPFECHLVPGPCAGWVEAVRARKISLLKPTAMQLQIAQGGKELMFHCERLAVAEDRKAAGSPTPGIPQDKTVGVRSEALQAASSFCEHLSSIEARSHSATAAEGEKR